MKTLFLRLIFLFAVTGWVAQSHGVALTIAPSAVSNTYNGTISFQVTGLTNGESVVVQKFLDANGNGVVDAGDTLWQAFKLTDGHASVFQDGAIAVTNMNVPGDTDSTTGQITALLNLPSSGFEQTIIGKYLFVLSSPFGNFTPLTNSFTITNVPYAQSLSGSVIANGTNVPNAVVLLFQPSSNNNLNPQGGVTADNSGNYQISAPAGDYVLLAFKSNFVANAGQASATLSNGVNLSTNLFLISADRTISGSFVDASNSALGLPGILLPVQTQDGLLTIAFTDTNGNFTAGVTSGQWKIESSDQGIAFHNYLRPQNKVQVDTTAGSVSGVTIALPKANALFYGAVKDGSNQPMAGISLASADGNNFEQDATTDAGGNYFAGAFGGPGAGWQIQTGSDSNPTNYIFSSPAFNFSQNGGTNLLPGQALLVNFTALLATNHITGHIQDSSNSPVANVQVVAQATINGANFQAQANTDGSGNYSVNVANGNWSVSVSCQGGQNSLDNIFGNGNYQCPGNQFANITNNNGVANFTVLPCGGIQVITTSPLASGQVGVFYSNQLFATSCNGNFNWTLNSGTFPPGLNLFGGGPINGTPTTNGTFNFTVHVADGGGASTNQNFSITINPAPLPPLLGKPAKSNGQFQFLLSGLSGQNYTIQTSTNLKSTNWSVLLVTNSPMNNFLIFDPNTTNPARFYRVLVGP